ncbi:conjugative transposon protein TraM [Chitinophaga sp. NPDC101104]|uniref:conjugative transposon protein TraM n=1 Tax=Chitinophaga sp. NPDC101104 TaxID=3390561 RepID=UPI003CFCA3E3
MTIQNRKKLARALLAVFFIPLAAIIFYSLGGGSADADPKQATNGLNSHLPSPSREDKEMDKLDTYKKAAADSAKLKEEENSKLLDYFSMRKQALPAPSETGAVESPFSPGTDAYANTDDRLLPPARRNEKQLSALENKLQRIQRTIDQQPEPVETPYNIAAPPDPAISHLENMMSSLQQSSNANPELDQMNNMLHTILDIQHPDRVVQRAKQQSLQKAGAAFPVSSVPKIATSAYFGGLTVTADTGNPAKLRSPSGSVFYGSRNALDTSFNRYQAIQAAIHEQQTLVSGSTVKMRLLQPVYIDGRLIPEGTFLFGSCQLTGERLTIDVTSIRNGNALYPVKLTVYDLDGNAGIRVPGSINRDASKQSADQAIQSAAIGTLDPSLGAQAASAGIETARKLLSKKIRLIRVTLSADYPVLLSSNDSSNN